MRSKHIVRPKAIGKHNTLDMRVTSKQGTELAKVIHDSVEHTQKYVQTELPNMLLVTQKQFASLNDYTVAMYQTTDRMYVTPWNVMEVKIDRDLDTIDEIAEVLDTVDKELKGGSPNEQ